MTTQINGNTGVSRVQAGVIEADDFDAALFLASKSANGYSYLPNGLIVQWGIMNTINSETSGTLFNFPIAFPNAVYLINATARGVAGGAECAEVYSVTNTNARILSVNGSGTSLSSAMNWLAIGH